MKKMLKMLLGAGMMSVCLSFSAFASSPESWEEVAARELGNASSVLLPEGVTFADELPVVARGRYIASSSVMIVNEGYGVLGVYADTLAYEAVKKIKMTVYIDQWDEENEDWIQVSSKSMTYEHQEDDEEDLHAASEYFLVENLEIDRYYRLRGVHAVWAFNGFIESHATMTNGVLLTDGPA